MTVVLTELYVALCAAGAPKDKAQAAAKALADRERRFSSDDPRFAKLRDELRALQDQIVTVTWFTGATCLGVLALILRTFVGA